MARQVVPVADLEKLENDVREVAMKLRACIDVATEAGMSSVLIHARSVKNTHLPEVKDWIETTLHDVRLQVNAYNDGRRSKAEKSVARAHAAEAAKKPKKRGKCCHCPE